MQSSHIVLMNIFFNTSKYLLTMMITYRNSRVVTNFYVTMMMISYCNLIHEGCVK